MEHNCIKDKEIGILAEHIKTLYKKDDAHEKRMDKLEMKQDAVHEIAKSIAVMAEQMSGTREDLKEVKDKVSSIETDVSSVKQQFQDEKVKSLEGELGFFRKHKSEIITFVIAAVLTVFLAKIGGLI